MVLFENFSKGNVSMVPKKHLNGWFPKKTNIGSLTVNYFAPFKETILFYKEPIPGPFKRLKVANFFFSKSVYWKYRIEICTKNNANNVIQNVTLIQDVLTI